MQDCGPIFISHSESVVQKRLDNQFWFTMENIVFADFFAENK